MYMPRFQRKECFKRVLQDRKKSITFVPEIRIPIQLINKKTSNQNNKKIINIKTLNKKMMSTTNNPTQLFLQEGYAFRRNVLSGKIEYCELHNEVTNNVAANNDGAGNVALVFRPFTQEDLNSVIMAAQEAMPTKARLHQELKTIIYSRSTPEYDPVREWLQGLPAWDGKNHVGALLDRLPGLRSEQRYWMSVWLRSMVAHWLQADQLHGNEVVPTFIGDQGCGKSTFCRLLLPEPLREYFLDHVNLGNKNDKEMALTNNLLVNIDELDQVRRSKQAELKQLLSKSRVNGRPIYGRVQADRSRYASFVATTNNHHPLHDPTGSRRFLCIELPSGQRINNEMPIDYEQLYAQILAEYNAGERYWFTEEETRALQRANAPFQSTIDLERIVQNCFRLPADDEPCKPVPMTSIVEIVARQYPFVEPTHSTKVQLGLALSACGFRMERDNRLHYYYAIPRDAA
ncbi:MAG: helicase [Prevotella sp.]|nr:helicase [Prevotella sp.]